MPARQLRFARPYSALLSQSEQDFLHPIWFARQDAHMPGLLQDHIAVVTGAGSGIGRAIALGFAREGASVAALDINGDTAAQTAASIRAAGGIAEAFTIDIADRAACAATAADVARRMGAVSVLVNNAGINRRTPFTGEPAAVVKDWDDIMAINLDGMFNVTHAFLATLRATKGRIVNIASVQSFAHMRTPNSAAYTTAKHGVLGFTRALAAELGKDGVRVNAVGPGLIETPLNAQARAKNPDIARLSVERTPLGRTGQPEDVVGPAIFLASDLAGYVTGSIIMADGGYRTV
jgi:NAD(P)-dependent dehydrogenase (short-subunit alcohol dehydrogenase family)